MNNQYLTEYKKKIYMEDFKNLLLTDREFWKIDNDELKKILIHINTNPNIQTLYSKYTSSSKPTETSSYLTFAYSKKVELKIFRELIPFFMNNYNSNSTKYMSSCNYDFSLPKINLNFENKSEKFGIGCTDDINYFKINNIKINLESEFSKVHNDFWNDLKIKFNEL